MWLVLDIGNTAVKGGLFDDASLERSFALTDHPAASTHRWREALAPALTDVHITRVGLASVVPESTAAAQSALQGLTSGPVEVVDATARLPFRLAYETPATLGADRLAAAVGAWVMCAAPPPRPVIAIDAGTAVTYEVIDVEKGAGVYRGGAIGAGPELLRRALKEGTAQLPHVDIKSPSRCIGHSTSEALQSGLFFGFIDAVQGMLARLCAEVDEQPAIVLTGGWSGPLTNHLDTTAHVDPHLVLRGIRLLLAGAKAWEH